MMQKRWERICKQLLGIMRPSSCLSSISLRLFFASFALTSCILYIPTLQGALDPTSWLQSAGLAQESDVSETTAIALCSGVLDDTAENEEESMEFDPELSGVSLAEDSIAQRREETISSALVANIEAPASQGIKESSPLVPAFFIFGDSTVDSGNNNYLGTFARANNPPYGRDFDTHLPTGRFCNGRLTIDYLAVLMGLPFVPTYLGLGGIYQHMQQGVNFASAGAGVLFNSGSDLGQHISLTQQIQQASDTFQTMSLFLGEKAAKDIVSESLIYVSIGSNDYIHFYLRNVSGVRSISSPWKFNQLLIETISNELQHLYNLNARRMVCIGMGPLGCAPRFLWESNSIYGECAEEVNNMIIEYNFAMKYMVQQLNAKLPDANIVFCDIYDGIMDILQNPERYGFQNTLHACCGIGKYGGLLMCLTPEMACNDASSYIWWDEYHPTDAVNAIIADNLWLSKYANICEPMDIHDLVTIRS